MFNRLAVGVVAALAGAAFGQGGKIGLLQIEGTPLERPAELSWLMGTVEPTLRELVEAVQVAAADEEIGSIVVRLKDAALSRTQVEELGAAMKTARATGKKVRLFCENYGPAEVILGSYADEVIVQAGGEVSLPGMHMEEMYLADTLSWIGIKPDMVQVGPYKGANEQYMNSAPSKEWNENIDQLLDSLYGAMRAQIMDGRKLSEKKLDEAMAAAWMADAEEAKKAGLIDTAVDLPALGEHIAGSKDAKWSELAVGNTVEADMDSANPFAAMTKLAELFTTKPEHKPAGPAIAVLHINGVIVDGDSSEGGMFGGGSQVGSRTIRNAIEQIRAEENVKGVVVRVDSPGGSAIASEVMWRGIKRLAEVKPVWVSVGSMAASGGYYVSVAGDRIYVNPSSIVGSIGVVGGKMSLGGLYEKGKVRVVGRGRGPMADLFDSTKPWNEQQLALVRDKMTKTFDLFKSRVAEGREGIDLSKTAGGWLFAGEKAIQMKMADKIGGLDDAIADLASAQRMESFEVLDYPAPMSIPELLEQFAKGFGVQAPRVELGQDLIAAARAVVGEDRWPAFAGAVRGLMLLRDEPVVLVMPSAITIK